MTLVLITGSSILSGQSEKRMNPYPETPEEIAAYRKHLVHKHHENSHYPDDVIRISSLKELAEYDGKSNVHVRMKPGVYDIGIGNYKTYLESDGKNGKHHLINFSGNHSFFDLRGVEIRIDSRIAPASNQPLGEVTISGAHLVIKGLTITNFMNAAPVGGNHTVTCQVGGKENLLQDLNITARGTHPYGYGDYLAMKNSWNLPKVPKRTALGAGGQNNVFVGVEVYNRGNGHAVGWPGSGDQTFINCHVEGEVRLTDDIIDELSEPGYGPRFEADVDIDERIQSLPYHLGPGRMTSLGEDAFRAYGGEGHGTVKILGCTVKNVRNVFIRGNYESSFISNTTVLRKWGFHTNHAKKTEVINCKTDVLYGMFLVIYGGQGREIDLTVVPADRAFLPVDIGTKGRSALIDGRDHTVVLEAERELRIKNPPPINVKGQNIKLRNETGLPIILTSDAKNCEIVTNGKVTDNGQENQIKHID